MLEVLYLIWESLRIVFRDWNCTSLCQIGEMLVNIQTFSNPQELKTLCLVFFLSNVESIINMGAHAFRGTLKNKKVLYVRRTSVICFLVPTDKSFFALPKIYQYNKRTGFSEVIFYSLIPPWAQLSCDRCSCTAETLHKYRIDFNFSLQLAADFGLFRSSHSILDAARRSHLSKSSHSQLRVGKSINVFQPGIVCV